MKFLYVAILLFFLSACSLRLSVPISKLTGTTALNSEPNICSSLFVTESWQFVHSITFEMSGGYPATVVGVTVIDNGVLKTALMGVEGFVLFEAELGTEKEIKVLKAMPPFDKPDFAAGLIRDVQTLFFVPDGSDVLLGKDAAGKSVCRYFAKSGQVTDVIVSTHGWSRVDVFDQQGVRNKSIIAGKYALVDNAYLPESIQLTASGLGAYTLQMKLLSAEKI